MKRLPLLTCLVVLAAPVFAADTLPYEKPIGSLQVVATFSGPMLTGVAVSSAGRIFVNYPRWGDKVDFTVAELHPSSTGVNMPTAYPPNINQTPGTGDPTKSLISVQSVVIDPQDRLWIVDTGSVEMGPTQEGGPKLIGVDLKTNQVFKTISFPHDVALPTTYLNDVRFDLKRGTEGTAFITDSSDKGPNGIIVVDLATGKSIRRLNDHPSTKADPNFLPIVEGQPLLERQPGQPPKHMGMGSDGIAISADGKRLYYCPLASRHLYSVSVDALVDPAQTDAQVAATVTDHGDKGGGSDGLETDKQGRIYATNYEHNSIERLLPDGTFETIVRDPHILWPDTLSVASDGYLYFTNNQLHRQGKYQNGKDLRQKPYSLLRVKLDSGPMAKQ